MGVEKSTLVWSPFWMNLLLFRFRIFICILTLNSTTANCQCLREESTGVWISNTWRQLWNTRTICLLPILGKREMFCHVLDATEALPGPDASGVLLPSKLVKSRRVLTNISQSNCMVWLVWKKIWITQEKKTWLYFNLGGGGNADWTRWTAECWPNRRQIKFALIVFI